MSGLKIKIDTAAAERASAQLRKSLKNLGSSAVENEKEFKNLESRMLKGLKADKAKSNIDALSKSLKLSRLEMAKHQARIGDYGGAFKTMNASLGKVNMGMVGLSGAIAGVGATYAIANLSHQFIEAASSAERLQIQLDTITKGKGVETFDALNQWAAQMPLNTDKAIEAYKNLRAMGLEPTIKDMTVLVDATSALGGSPEIMEGIARALGQMSTKGKVTTEELLQLAERGIPAFKILEEQMGLTKDQLGDIGRAGLDVDQVLKALMKGMESRYGGASEKMMKTWDGMIESMKATSVEFARGVMDSGPFEAMKVSLKSFLDYLNTNEGQMDLALWAEETAVVVVDSFVVMTRGLNVFLTGLQNASSLYAGFVSQLKSFRLMGIESGLKDINKSINSGFATDANIEFKNQLLAQQKELKAEIKYWDDLGVSAAGAAIKTDAAISKLTEKLSAFSDKTKKVTLFGGGADIGGVGIGGSKPSPAGGGASGGSSESKYHFGETDLDQYWDNYQQRQIDAVAAATQFELETMNAAQEKKRTIVQSFQDDYKSATMTSTAYELDQLNRRYDEYAKHINDKSMLDEWYAAESKHIVETETDVWGDAFAGWANSYTSTLNDMLWGVRNDFWQYCRILWKNGHRDDHPTGAGQTLCWRHDRGRRMD